MNRLALASSLAPISLAAALALLSSRAMPRQVTAEGNRLRIYVCGRGSPTVVFDTFGPANLEIWGQVQSRVSRFACTVAYDHGGYWGSEPGRTPRDARQLAGELHRALRNAALDPPYILIGYSMGGPYTRVFASLYPDDVAGLVLVDPTQEAFMDWFRDEYPDWARVSPRHVEAQDEIGSLSVSFDQARAARLPDVPITLITGMKPYDTLTHALLPRWLESHRHWLRTYPHARHIVTTNSGHNVALNEPDLVADAVREMMERNAWRAQ